MALFSRGPKAAGPAAEPVTPPADAETAEAVAVDAEAVDAVAGAVPAVSISTTAYDGFGSAAAAHPAGPEPTGEAPEPVETLPGLPDNVVLHAALAALGENPEGHEILGVARQLLQGNVYLRIQGNAQELVAAGADLPLAIATRDEGQFVMLYSSGAALAAAVTADGDTETSAMGQAAPAVLQYVLQGEFAGIMVDHASAPASVVLPRELIERIFAEMDPRLAIKHLVAGPRGENTAAEVAQAMTEAPLWIAVNRASEDDDWGVAETRTEAGERILPVFSHPLEVIALGRGDRPVPFSPAQLGSALRDDEGIAGIVVDPAGPWIRLDRADLAPVIALPEPEASDQVTEEKAEVGMMDGEQEETAGAYTDSELSEQAHEHPESHHVHHDEVPGRYTESELSEEEHEHPTGHHVHRDEVPGRYTESELSEQEHEHPDGHHVHRDPVPGSYTAAETAEEAEDGGAHDRRHHRHDDGATSS